MSSKKRKTKNSKHTSPVSDPFASREAEKYENPIPSREFIMSHVEGAAVPVNFRRLVEAFSLEGEQAVALKRRLRAMVRDGQLVRSRSNYQVIKNKGVVKGRFIGHRDGFGFVVPEEGGDDVYLNHREARSLMHDDEVLVRVTGFNPKGRKEAMLVDVLERRSQEVVGRYFEEGGMGFVTPSNKRMNKDILIAKKDKKKATPGQFVVANVTHQPTPHSPPMGCITEILGDHMAPGMEIDVAIRSHDLSHKWSDAVKDELKAMPDSVQESDLDGRKDLRDLPFVTIDGDDAKDFDDAVYCEQNAKGHWRLYVAIADVAHYVKPNSALDSEAMHRGNSVYFPGRVIPMLPEKLSNGLCSLKPNVDRLVMVCDVALDEAGKQLRSRFYPAVIHSHARLTYTAVYECLQGKPANINTPLIPHVKKLHDLYTLLRLRRDTRGAIDLDTIETKIVFGKDKKIEKIVPVERNDAHKLIEECMLCANVAAARFIERNKLVNLYRIHETPKLERTEQLCQFLSELGIPFKPGDPPDPKNYAALLEKIRTRKDFHIIQTILLRSLAQAQYSPDNKGHFGLAFQAYAHFTSPIRRYPDLLIHRAIKAELNHESPEQHYDKMAMMGEHCSDTERRADEATRDAIDWLKCEYMLDKVGEEFSGIISSVTSFGLFVELKDIYVEGLVHITTIENDYFCFDPMRHRLLGETTGKRYQLGDELRVRVERVDLDERHIDFRIVL